MPVHIRWGQQDKSDALGTFIHEQVDHALRHHVERFTRVDVHLHDDKLSRAGANDKRCVIEARPRGAEPLVVDATGDDFYKTISTVSKKLERAVHHFVDRHRDH